MTGHESMKRLTTFIYDLLLGVTLAEGNVSCENVARVGGV